MVTASELIYKRPIRLVNESACSRVDIDIADEDTGAVVEEEDVDA